MKKRSPGFTLIEVLVAVVLLAIISLLIWQAMGSLADSKDRSEKRDRAYREASLSLDRIARDLSMAVLYSSLDLLGVSAGGEQWSKSVFIGTNQGDEDKLIFDTLSHLRHIKDAKESDLAEVTYFLEPMKSDNEDIDTSDLFVLKKREKTPLDTAPGENGLVYTYLEFVRELNFRYYDSAKGEYKEDWDTTQIDDVNRLPRVVEINLVVQDPYETENSVSLQTLVTLEMAPGPQDF